MKRMMTGKRERERDRLAYLDERRPRRGISRGRLVLLLVILALLVLVLPVAVWRSLFVRPVPIHEGTVSPGPVDEGPEEAPDPWAEYYSYGTGIRPRSEGARKSEDYYTVLILGRDTYGGGNTDTMLLASYDVTHQRATVMSLPRDTMINVDWDVKKLNSVYGMYGGGERGMQEVYKEVAQLVGFEPDFRVIVEWEAVGKVVDAIGGVWFDNPYPMDYHDPKQDLVIEQEQGWRLMMGEDAMQIIRWRANDNDSPYGYRKRDGGIGDDGRMQLQQDFLKAVLRDMLDFQNVGAINKIAKVFEENVETDLSFQNVLWFAQKAFVGGLVRDDVEFLTMPYKITSAWSRSYEQNLSYVVPEPQELLDIVNEKLSPYVEPFAMSDLDIMSVNRDGTISSSTGRVEDRQANSSLPTARRTGASVSREDGGASAQFLSASVPAAAESVRDTVTERAQETRSVRDTETVRDTVTEIARDTESAAPERVGDASSVRETEGVRDRETESVPGDAETPPVPTDPAPDPIPTDPGASDAGAVPTAPDPDPMPETDAGPVDPPAEFALTGQVPEGS